MKNYLILRFKNGTERLCSIYHACHGETTAALNIVSKYIDAIEYNQDMDGNALLGCILKVSILMKACVEERDVNILQKRLGILIMPTTKDRSKSDIVFKYDTGLSYFPREWGMPDKITEITIDFSQELLIAHIFKRHYDKKAYLTAMDIEDKNELKKIYTCPYNPEYINFSQISDLKERLQMVEQSKYQTLRCIMDGKERYLTIIK